MHCFGLGSGPFLLFQCGIFATTTVTLPQLLVKRLCLDRYNATVCAALSTSRFHREENRIQKDAAIWLTVLPMTSLGLVLVSILFVGQIADLIGKRRAMFICTILTFCQAIGFLTLVRVPGNFYPGWLFIPQCIPGIFGDSQGSLLISLAYKADITNLQERTVGIATTEGCFYISVAIFTLLSGFLLQKLGFEAVFGLNMVLSVMSFIYVLFVLPDESLYTNTNKENEHLLDNREENENADQGPEIKNKKGRQYDVSSILRFERIRNVLHLNGDGHSIFIDFTLLFLGVVPFIGLTYVGVLYTTHSPFGLNAENLGYLIATVFVGQSLGTLLVIPLITRYFRPTDFQLLALGFLVQIVYFTLIGSAITTWMLFGAQILVPFAIIQLPVARAILSKHASNNLHGSVLACAEFTDAFGSLITSVLGNLVYSKTVSIFPGIIFYVYAVVSMIGFFGSLLVIFLTKRNKYREN